MSKLISKLLTPTALLYVYHVLTAMALGVYHARGVEAPNAFAVVLPLGYLWIVGWWLRTDSRQRGVNWPWDELSLLWLIAVYALTGVVLLLTGDDPHKYDRPSRGVSKRPEPKFAFVPGPGQVGAGFGVAF